MKSFKQHLIEASKQRLNRIIKSTDVAERQMAEFGGLEPSHEGDFDPFSMADLITFNPEHPIVQRYEGLENAFENAAVKDRARIVKIADQLKERNPDRYRELIAHVKPHVLGLNQHRIDRATERLQKFRDANAPNFLIKNEQKHIDEISDSIGEQIHFKIGELHRNQMTDLYKP